MENSKYVLKFLPNAKNDLDSIYDYIRNELCNLKAATDLMNDFETAFQRIQQFPESCPQLKYETQYRKLIVNDYIAFYKIDKREIIVFRILYGYMNYNKYL